VRGYGVPETEVTVERDGGAAILRLAGEIDLHDAPTLASAVDEVADGWSVVVDLTDATFVDPAVLGCLVRLRRRLPSPDCVVLYGPTQPVRRAFELSGLDRYFSILAAA
jgi:anti-anti-sigma factor